VANRVGGRKGHTARRPPAGVVPHPPPGRGRGVSTAPAGDCGRCGGCVRRTHPAPAKRGDRWRRAAPALVIGRLSSKKPFVGDCTIRGRRGHHVNYSGRAGDTVSVVSGGGQLTCLQAGRLRAPGARRRAGTSGNLSRTNRRLAIWPDSQASEAVEDGPSANGPVVCLPGVRRSRNGQCRGGPRLHSELASHRSGSPGVARGVTGTKRGRPRWQGRPRPSAATGAYEERRIAETTRRHPCRGASALVDPPFGGVRSRPLAASAAVKIGGRWSVHWCRHWAPCPRAGGRRRLLNSTGCVNGSVPTRHNVPPIDQPRTPSWRRSRRKVLVKYGGTGPW